MNINASETHLAAPENSMYFQRIETAGEHPSSQSETKWKDSQAVQTKEDKTHAQLRAAIKVSNHELARDYTIQCALKETWAHQNRVFFASNLGIVCHASWDELITRPFLSIGTLPAEEKQDISTVDFN